MNAPIRYQANPDVSCGDEEDGAVLFNPDTDDTAAINTSGRLLWAFLAEPRTVDELAAHLIETYQGVGAEQAEADTAAFVESLTPDFLIEVNDGD